MSKIEGDSKRVLRDILVGGMVGLISYIILFFISSPWEEIIPAFLIGSVPGIVERKRIKIFIGSLFSSIGLFIGILTFGVFFEIGLGAWIIAGAFLGMISGIYNGSFWRALIGLFLGMIAGVVAEASRYITVFFDFFRVFDMQLILLFTAGILLSLTSSLVTKQVRRK